MGTCSSSEFPDIFPHLYRQFRPQAIEAHVLALMQLEHFSFRKNYLISQARDDINEVASQMFEEVQSIESNLQILYEDQTHAVSQSDSSRASPNLSKVQIAEELSQLHQAVTAVKERLGLNFQRLEQQLLNYLHEQLNSIETNLTKDIVQIKYSNQLTPHHTSILFRRLTNTLGTRFRQRRNYVQDQLQLVLNPHNLATSLAKARFDAASIIQQLELLEALIQNGQRMTKTQKKTKEGWLELIIDYDEIQTPELEQINEIQQQFRSEIIGEVKKTICSLKAQLTSISNRVCKTQPKLQKGKAQQSKLRKPKNSTKTSTSTAK